MGWAKRKRGKDGNLIGEGSQDTDPKKKRLKMDVMALSKAERERLKALVKVSICRNIKAWWMILIKESLEIEIGWSHMWIDWWVQELADQYHYQFNSINYLKVYTLV